MLSWFIWRSRDCPRPTLICFMQKFAYLHAKIDAFLMIGYTVLSVWCRSFGYPRLGFQFVPRRIVLIGSTVVCCPSGQSPCLGEVAANSSAFHWLYVFLLPIVGFSLFFCISCLCDLTHMRTSFVTSLYLCSYARAWMACRSLHWSLHEKARCRVRFQQRWRFVIINQARVLAPNAVNNMILIYMHQVIDLSACLYWDGIRVFTFSSGDSCSSGVEPGLVLVFATKMSTVDRFLHHFVKHFGEVRMRVKFIMKSHV